MHYIALGRALATEESSLFLKAAHLQGSLSQSDSDKRPTRGLGTIFPNNMPCLFKHPLLCTTLSSAALGWPWLWAGMVKFRWMLLSLWSLRGCVEDRCLCSLPGINNVTFRICMEFARMRQGSWTFFKSGCRWLWKTLKFVLLHL